MCVNVRVCGDVCECACVCVVMCVNVRVCGDVCECACVCGDVWRLRAIPPALILARQVGETLNSSLVISGFHLYSNTYLVIML